MWLKMLVRDLRLLESFTFQHLIKGVKGEVFNFCATSVQLSLTMPEVEISGCVYKKLQKKFYPKNYTHKTTIVFANLFKDIRELAFS